MHVLVTNFNENPNVGLYGMATDTYCLVGKEVSKKTAAKIEEALKVPVHRVMVAGTSLIGVFCKAVNNNLYVPSIIFQSELEELKKITDVQVIQTDLTCLGNNILVGKKGCLVNPDCSNETIDQLKTHLGLPVKKGTIGQVEVVGSVGLAYNDICLVHPDITDDEVKLISDFLGLEPIHATVSMGSPFISSGIISNSKGFVISEMSGGPEIQHIDESFGFIKV